MARTKSIKKPRRSSKRSKMSILIGTGLILLTLLNELNKKSREQTTTKMIQTTIPKMIKDIEQTPLVPEERKPLFRKLDKLQKYINSMNSCIKDTVVILPEFLKITADNAIKSNLKRTCTAIDNGFENVLRYLKDNKPVVLDRGGLYVNIPREDGKFEKKIYNSILEFGSRRRRRRKSRRRSRKRNLS